MPQPGFSQGHPKHEMSSTLLAWAYSNEKSHTGHAVDYALYEEMAIVVPHGKAILHVLGMS